ncbi:MAG: O-methyltransferase [Bacteroidia bacterium]|nr:O-methyltransferase [Bacteroidia bacterium]
MDIINQTIEKYCEQHTEPESELLYTINRETHSEVLMPRMLSGHLQGRFLAMLSKMIKPNNILEIGTFTGYASLCLLEGIQPKGKLITIDINEELEPRVRKYFNQHPMANQIEYMIGNALEIIPQLNKTFDLVFIDADKVNYLNYYKMVIDKVSSGGYIIADNVLWSGKVIEQNNKPDKDTTAMLQYNKFVAEDTRVESFLLPLRDGLMICGKK